MPTEAMRKALQDSKFWDLDDNDRTLLMGELDPELGSLGSAELGRIQNDLREQWAPKVLEPVLPGELAGEPRPRGKSLLAEEPAAANWGRLLPMMVGRGLPGSEKLVAAGLGTLSLVTGGLESTVRTGLQSKSRGLFDKVHAAAEASREGYLPNTIEMFMEDPSFEQGAKSLLDTFIKNMPHLGAIVASGVSGGPVGAAFMSYMFATGELYLGLAEKGVDSPGMANLVGIPNAMLDYAVPGGRWVKQWIPTPKLLRSLGFKDLALQIAKGAARDFTTEGITEAIQEANAVLLEHWKGVGDDPRHDVMRIVAAGIGGAFTGGVLGGMNQAALDMKSLRRDQGPPPEINSTPLDEPPPTGLEPTPDEPAVIPEPEPMVEPDQPVVPSEPSGIDITLPEEEVIPEEAPRMLPALEQGRTLRGMTNGDLEGLLRDKSPEFDPTLINSTLEYRKHILRDPTEVERAELKNIDTAQRRIDAIQALLDQKKEPSLAEGIDFVKGKIVLAKTEEDMEAATRLHDAALDHWYAIGAPASYVQDLTSIHALMYERTDQLEAGLLDEKLVGTAQNKAFIVKELLASEAVASFEQTVQHLGAVGPKADALTKATLKIFEAKKSPAGPEILRPEDKALMDSVEKQPEVSEFPLSYRQMLEEITYQIAWLAKANRLTEPDSWISMAEGAWENSEYDPKVADDVAQVIRFARSVKQLNLDDYETIRPTGKLGMTLDGDYMNIPEDEPSNLSIFDPPKEDFLSLPEKEDVSNFVADMAAIHPEEGAEWSDVYKAMHFATKYFGLAGVYTEGTFTTRQNLQESQGEHIINLRQSTPEETKSYRGTARFSASSSARYWKAGKVETTPAGDFRYHPDKSIDTENQRSIRVAFEDSQLGYKLGGFLTKYLHKTLEQIEINADTIPNKVAGSVRRIIKGVMLNIIPRQEAVGTILGEFHIARTDGDFIYLEIAALGHAVRESLLKPKGEGFLLTPDINEVAAGLYGTLVHEISHIFSYHETKVIAGEDVDISPFPLYLAMVTQATSNLREDFINEYKKIVGQKKDPDVFGREFLQWLESAKQGKLVPALARRYGQGIVGPAAQPSGQGRDRGGYPYGGQPRGAGARSTGASRLDSWETAAYGEGTFPEPSDEYKSAIEGISRDYNRGVESEVARPMESPAFGGADGINEMVGRLAQVAGRDPDGPQGRRIIQDMVHFFRRLHKAQTLRQIARPNRHIREVRHYLQLDRLYSRTKLEVIIAGDRVLKQWEKLNKNRRDALGKFAYAAMERSEVLKARLTQLELSRLAARFKIDQEMLDIYHQMDGTLQTILDKLEKAVLRDQRSRLGQGANLVIDQIKREFQLMRDRNFFPTSRFGQFAVYIKAQKPMIYDGKDFKTGGTISFESFATETDAENRAKEWRSKGLDIDAKTTRINDEAAQFMNFSPVLFELMQDRLNLSGPQLKELRAILATLAPSKSFVQHLRKKAGVAGYSEDAMRTYGEYMQHAAGHLARARHKTQMENVLASLKNRAKSQTYSDVDMQGLFGYLSQHLSSLISPVNSLAAVRSLLFTWYFFGVPKQAVVNAIQVPVFGFSWLGKRMGGPAGVKDAILVKIMAKALKDSVQSFTKPGVLNQGQQEILDWAEKQGLTDQSFASALAAIVAGHPLLEKMDFLPANWERSDAIQRSLMWSRRAAQIGVVPFAAQEKLNRRIMVLAAYEVAMRSGKTKGQMRQFVEDCIDETMFNYDASNRPQIMQGKKAVLFVFRLYQQHALDFIFQNAGGARFYLIQLALAGLLGLPFAEDLLELANWLLTGMRKTLGVKEPYIDLEQEAREYLSAIFDNPEVALRGLAGAGFGIGIPWLLTVGDLSTSISLGRQVPMLQPIIRGLSGRADADSAIVRAVEEALGVAGASGFNIARATMDDTGASMATTLAMPAALKNLRKGLNMLETGKIVNSRGQELLPVDVNDPSHIGEIVGQLLGMTPSRAITKQKYVGAQRGMIGYYLGWRESFLIQYARAIGNDDKEAVAEGKRQLKKYNQVVPPLLRLTGSQVAESIRTRVKNEKLRAMGLPTQKRYIPLAMELRQYFPELEAK